MIFMGLLLKIYCRLIFCSQNIVIYKRKYDNFVEIFILPNKELNCLKDNLTLYLAQ